MQLGPIMAQLMLRGTKARALLAWELEGVTRSQTRLRRLGLNQVHAPTSNRSRLLRSQLQQLGPIMAQLVLRGTKARVLMAWELEGVATLANAAPSLSVFFLFLQLIS
jgi:hypothetical protein